MAMELYVKQLLILLRGLSKTVLKSKKIKLFSSVPHGTESFIVSYNAEHNNYTIYM